MIRQHYTPTKAEKKVYLKQYFGAVVIGLIFIAPFIVYFAQMKH